MSDILLDLAEKKFKEPKQDLLPDFVKSLDEKSYWVLFLLSFFCRPMSLRREKGKRKPKIGSPDSRTNHKKTALCNRSETYSLETTKRSPQEPA